MPLNVSYKNRIGYYTETQTHGDTKNRYRIWLCHSNSLCAMMYFYNLKEEDGKTTPMAQLHSFFVDNAHARRCIKDDYFRNCSNFHFYEKEMNPDLWKLVKDLTAHGIKVTIE